MILLDDSFVSITHAIAQGRHIFYSLQRVILYFFATNLGEILIVMFALILGLPLPLTAVQILWLNLVTDGFLDVALAMEPQEAGLLESSWLKQKVHLVDRAMILQALYMALPMALGSIIVFAYYTWYNVLLAQTMTLVLMAMFQWFNAWNCRSTKLSIFELKLLGNVWLVGATLLVFALQLMLVYVPFMQKIFDTVPLTLSQWLLIVAISSSIIVFEEIRKWVFKIKTFNR